MLFNMCLFASPVCRLLLLGSGVFEFVFLELIILFPIWLIVSVMEDFKDS